MVEGLDRFSEHFAAYTDQYVLIGGAACTLAMEDVGQTFRATKDLDIVLSLEALDEEFVAAFWEFVRAGAYEIQEKATGEKRFYRFQKPANDGYPFMLELFSRIPDALSIADDSHLTPIPVDAELSSLSAILLEGDYYDFLQSGKRIVSSVPIVGPEHLIPLKAKAWLDLSQRAADGIKVDSKDLKKHKNDVFRLFVIVDPDFSAEIPPAIKSDLSEFIDRMTTETIALKNLGLGNQTLDGVLMDLRTMYGLD